MKTPLQKILLSVFVFFFSLSTAHFAATAVLLNETFETGWTAGTTLNSSTAINGWTGTSTTDATKGFIEISGTSYHSSAQSLHLVDNLAGYSAASAYNLGSNFSSGYVDFWMAQDSNYSTTNFRVDFFTTTNTNNFNVVIGDLGSGTGIYVRNGSNTIVASSVGIAGFTATNWNNYRVTFDQASLLISISFNGTSVLTLNSTQIANISAINLGKLQLNAGYSGGTNMGAYFDDIQIVSIPEPGIFMLFALGLILMGSMFLPRLRNETL